jgi:hypothetical protein
MPLGDVFRVRMSLQTLAAYNLYLVLGFAPMPEKQVVHGQLLLQTTLGTSGVNGSFSGLQMYRE